MRKESIKEEDEEVKSYDLLCELFFLLQMKLFESCWVEWEVREARPMILFQFLLVDFFSCIYVTLPPTHLNRIKANNDVAVI